MRLLDLPQELLDLIATHLDAFSFSTLKCTSKDVYKTLGGDSALKRALVDLEVYWSRESHVMAVLLKEPHVQPEPYPSYKRFLKRAPCYSCLRITTPSDTLFHTHHGKYRNIPMLPWDGFGGFDTVQLNASDSQRRCIDCSIRAVSEAGGRQSIHVNMKIEYVLFCVGCQQKVCMAHRPVSRQARAALCDLCFRNANPGWHAFKARLGTRMRRLSRYQSWLRTVLKRELRRPSGPVDSRWLRTGPLPPAEDVHEDWALWREIFHDDSSHKMNYAELSHRFAKIIAHMQSYLSWMLLVDEGRNACTHKMFPPASEQFSEHGEWPMWPAVVQEMSHAIENWGQAPCGESCRRRVQAIESVVEMRESLRTNLHVSIPVIEAVQA